MTLRRASLIGTSTLIYKVCGPYVVGRVVYCVVTEANPGIMSFRHDTYPS
jgi:hypothetical protein